MNIIQDFIPAGRRNRPVTAPQSSLYGRKMTAKYITIHNPASPGWNAKQLHDYGKSQGTVGSLKSWHFSVDKDNAYQMLPTDESGWHAGDNLGPGNTTSIAFEICDRGAYAKNWPLFWQDQEHAAEVCAHLIKTIPSLHPFPACIVQHNKWSGKNCPYWIRQESGGWQRFLNFVDKYLREPEQPPADPDVFYRVIVGSYNDRANAERAMAEAKAKGFSSAFIVAFRRGE